MSENLTLAQRKKAEYLRDADRRRNLALDRYYTKREKLNLVKAKPCQDCGNCFPPECMDFDHRPGEVKSFGVGVIRSYSWKRIEQEIAKCDLVCANCHRVRTASRMRENLKPRRPI